MNRVALETTLRELRTECERFDATSRDTASVFRDRLNLTADRITSEEKRRTATDSPRGERDAEDSAAVPVGYLKVMDRVDAGEVSWVEVMTGDTDDSNVRRAHEWVTPRLEVVARAGRLMGDGLSAHRALEIAVHERRAGGGR